MCLAIPARVVAIDPATDTATVALGAVTKAVSLALVEDLTLGDYVLVHVGYALTRISPEEAELTLSLMAEAAQFSDQPAELPADQAAAAVGGGEGTP
jgi:hydrogenase expression/formation protein HypC